MARLAVAALVLASLAAAFSGAHAVQCVKLAPGLELHLHERLDGSAVPRFRAARRHLRRGSLRRGHGSSALDKVAALASGGKVSTADKTAPDYLGRGAFGAVFRATLAASAETDDEALAAFGVSKEDAAEMKARSFVVKVINTKGARDGSDGDISGSSEGSSEDSSSSLSLSSSSTTTSSLPLSSILREIDAEKKSSGSDSLLDSVLRAVDEQLDGLSFSSDSSTVDGGRSSSSALQSSGLEFTDSPYGETEFECQVMRTLHGDEKAKWKRTVPKCYGFGPKAAAGGEPDVTYMFMEMVGTSSLAKVINQGLKVADVLLYTHQLARAVNLMHKHNLAHMDIKPDNIRVDHAQRRLWLIDFGGARPIDLRKAKESGLVYPKGVVTTLFYADVLAAWGASPDFAANDAFMLGRVMQHMLGTPLALPVEKAGRVWAPRGVSSAAEFAAAFGRVASPALMEDGRADVKERLFVHSLLYGIIARNAAQFEKREHRLTPRAVAKAIAGTLNLDAGFMANLRERKDNAIDESALAAVGGKAEVWTGPVDALFPGKPGEKPEHRDRLLAQLRPLVKFAVDTTSVEVLDSAMCVQRDSGSANIRSQLALRFFAGLLAAVPESAELDAVVASVKAADSTYPGFVKVVGGVQLKGGRLGVLKPGKDFTITWGVADSQQSASLRDIAKNIPAAVEALF